MTPDMSDTQTLRWGKGMFCVVGLYHMNGVIHLLCLQCHVIDSFSFIHNSFAIKNALWSTSCVNPLFTLLFIERARMEKSFYKRNNLILISIFSAYDGSRNLSIWSQIYSSYWSKFIPFGRKRVQIVLQCNSCMYKSSSTIFVTRRSAFLRT